MTLFVFFFFCFCAEQQYWSGYCDGRIGAYDDTEANCQGKASKPGAAEDVHYQHNYKCCERCHDRSGNSLVNTVGYHLRIELTGLAAVFPDTVEDDNCIVQ